MLHMSNWGRVMKVKVGTENITNNAILIVGVETTQTINQVVLMEVVQGLRLRKVL
ncbi:hypothetical protein PESP_a2729 [Pseudoalteromonas espejiana DSM 9414]|nr:hypothetical protein PESP_a2729 [Pseudoalteromonas espejiana DSM 9414]